MEIDKAKWKEFISGEPQCSVECGWTPQKQQDSLSKYQPFNSLKLEKHMSVMRAKMKVDDVKSFDDGSEQLVFDAVCKSGSYPEDGSDEDNTFAMFTPSADLNMLVNNPALKGKFKVGQKFYVDFTETGD